MKNLFVLITLFITIGLMVGCGPRNLEAGAENVSIIPNKAYIPNNCKFLGEISGTNVHGDMDLTSSQQDLALDHTNFLKNEAKRLGANVVIFDQPKSIDKQIFTPGKHPHRTMVTTHDIVGSAYVCSSSTRTILKQWRDQYPTNKMCKRMMLME
jgi:hypothetical protein